MSNSKVIVINTCDGGVMVGVLAVVLGPCPIFALQYFVKSGDKLNVEIGSELGCCFSLTYTPVDRLCNGFCRLIHVARNKDHVPWKGSH